MVGHGLGETVERVEGVGGEGGGHNPLVVRLVQTLVDERMVQPTVDPVDAEIGEHDKEGELEPVVGRERGVLDHVVELGPAAHLEEHKEGGANRHEGHSGHGLLDFEGDLIFEVLGVLHGLLVEYQPIGQGGKDEVEEDTE